MLSAARADSTLELALSGYIAEVQIKTLYEGLWSCSIHQVKGCFFALLLGEIGEVLNGWSNLKA